MRLLARQFSEHQKNAAGFTLHAVSYRLISRFRGQELEIGREKTFSIDLLRASKPKRKTPNEHFSVLASNVCNIKIW